MNKNFRLFFVLTLLSCTINESSFGWALFSKKSQEIADLEKVASSSSDLAKVCASLSSSLEANSQKIWSGEDDVTILTSLRILFKIFSEFFDWFSRLVSFLKTNFNNFQQAQKDLASAKKEKDQEKAENKKSLAVDALNKATNAIFGNMLLVLVANAKAAATVCLLTIKQLDFSQANISSIRKNFTNIKKQSDGFSVAMKSFEETISAIKEALGDEIEIDQEKIDKLNNHINTFLEILLLLSNYYTKEVLDEKVTKDMLNQLSLTNKALPIGGEKDDEEDE
ncbi:MAG: hypothetical protein LBB21_05980 [Holosporaceae bacterium]|nr:hypothetical protein [Holosporaceae bacterium]